MELAVASGQLLGLETALAGHKTAEPRAAAAATPAAEIATPSRSLGG
jgi:hypothetical protein